MKKKKLGKTKKRLRFMLRLQYEASSKEIAGEILEGLKEFVKYQTREEEPHPGTLTYNFSHVFEEERPDLLIFSELYSDDEVFMNHAFYPEIMKIYKRIFKQGNNVTMTCLCYGDCLPLTKKVLSMFNTKYIDRLAGYLVDEEQKNYDLRSPTQISIRLLTNEENKIKEIIDKLSVADENNKPFIFYLSKKNSGDLKYPDGYYELMMTYDNPTTLKNHLGSEQGIEKMKELNKFAKVLECQMWKQDDLGNNEQSLEVLRNCGFENAKERKVEVGYILHPDGQLNHRYVNKYKK